ncbi:MAG: hypothetical protein WAM14_05110, partial [Candidatus Nitrosopolaris sp.]
YELYMQALEVETLNHLRGSLPIILKQDNVVHDGHHELGLGELRFPVTSWVNPRKELRYVVSYNIMNSVNLHRRHLDKFQKAEIGLKTKISRDSSLNDSQDLHV